MAKILFADDEPDIQRMAKSILTREGYEVIIAKDGEEVLDLVKTHKPDLIILDYMMPVLDGLETCKALKKDNETKSIPVIMVTGYPEEKQNSLDVGAVDFISKPIDKTDLLLRIKWFESILTVYHDQLGYKPVENILTISRSISNPET